MNIDLNYKFLNIEGKVQRETDFEKDKNDIPIKDKNDNLIQILGIPFTLRSACINVLTNPPREIDERTGRPIENKPEYNLMLTELAREIYKSNGLINLSADDVKLLKDYINKRYNQNPLIITQAWEILDPTDVGKKKKKNKEKT